MNIKQKIMAIPLEFGHEEYGSRDLTAYEVRELCAEVAQLHMDRIELAHKFNLEAMEEASAGLAEQLLAERAKIDELIAEIDELVGIGQIVYCDQLITALDKWRTK